MLFNKFDTENTEIFNAGALPGMVNELAAVIQGIEDSPVYFKPQIIISYLKNHSIKTDWINANPELTAIIISGSLSTIYMESLFERHSTNKPFLEDFEAYIKGRILTR